MRAELNGSECAIVAGIDLNGLGVLRALGGVGVPIVALDTDLQKPTLATRFGQKLPIRALSGSVFVDELLELRHRFKCNPVLILTQEASVATVSAERDRLSSAYRFIMPGHVLMEALLDKLKFQTLAERYGFPIPNAIRLNDSENVAGVRDLRFPCVMKPLTKHAEHARRFGKAYKVADAQDVAGVWPAMREVIEEIIVQEWIEGKDSDVYFCLQYRPATGRPSLSFVGRKICQWPPMVGGTASCIPAPEAAAALTDLTNGFFDTVGFVGIGSMEYKRDQRDGRFYMVEPTVGRTDYQEEVATLNGVNIPFAAFCDAVGQPLPAPVAVAPPRAWRDPIGYARARMAGAPDPMLQFAPGIRIVDAYFRRDDAMPYVALKFQALKRRLSRVMGRHA